MPKQASARKYWMITVNNPVATDYTKLESLPYEYLIYQTEIGEQTGTEHIQAYVALQEEKRLTYLVKLLKAHYEPRYGSHSQAKAYCSKDETRKQGTSCVVLGSDAEIPDKKGSRSDLQQVKDRLDNGDAMLSIWDNHFGSACRYHKSFELYRNLKTEPRNPSQPPNVLILWGDRGTGKSRKAYELAPPPQGYWLTKPADPNQVWFDGYTAGQTLVIDEFYGWIKYEFFLRLIDRYPMDVKVHGGKIPFNSPNIIITSNRDCHQWYGYKKDPLNDGQRMKDPYFDISAWDRRIDEFCTVLHYVKGEPEPEVPPLTGTDPAAINSTQESE